MKVRLSETRLPLRESDKQIGSSREAESQTRDWRLFRVRFVLVGARIRRRLPSDFTSQLTPWSWLTVGTINLPREVPRPSQRPSRAQVKEWTGA